MILQAKRSGQPPERKTLILFSREAVRFLSRTRLTPAIIRPEPVVHHVFELSLVKWFQKVGLRPCLHRQHRALPRLHGSDHHDRHRWVLVSDLMKDLKAVDVGHADAEDEAVEGLLLQGRERATPIDGGADEIALRLQSILQQLANVRIVIYNEDALLWPEGPVDPFF
jgi:hypothetical protein